MKKINSKKNIPYSKMEKMALKFLDLNLKKKETKNNFSKNLEEYVKRNDSEELLNTSTKKDILTVDYQEKLSKIENNYNNINNSKENYINNSNYFSINSTDKINIKEKSKIPKEIEIVPKIQGLNEIAQDYINKLNQKNEESYSSSIINNTSESTNVGINLDILNKIYILYIELKKEFDNMHNLINDQNNNIFLNEEENLKKIIFKCIVLGRDYYTMFLFGEEIQKIIKLFNYCLDVGKFIIYQIYLFLSLIYLNEELPMKNNIEMSYRTLILYSSQNFQIILNLIKNPNLSSEPKIMKSIKIKNKIIISVLRLINQNIPSKEKIKEFIYKDKNNINNINNFTFKCIEEIDKNNMNNKINIERKANYNSLGIIQLILLLKKNKELSEKLLQIQKKVFLLTLNNYDKNQNNSKSENNNFNINILNDNNSPNETNYKPDSLSSLNKNININNNNNFNNNIKNNNLNDIEINNNNKINNNNIQNNNFILPLIDESKSNYKYYIFFELDETLVHYWEENDESFVKIRWNVEDCFSKISEFCEISIVSTSSQEYTEKIVEKFNKNGEYIKNIIYKEYDEDNLDLSMINRDMKKSIFICHEEEFFNAPKNNILRITEFQGDEGDREILFLTKEIMKLKDENINDITQVIPDMIMNIRI